MIDDKDIEKLVAVFATRQEIDAKFEGLRKDFSDLQSAVDGYAKKADDYFQEMVMLSHKIDRHEEWIKQIAEKVGVKLEY